MVRHGSNHELFYVLNVCREMLVVDRSEVVVKRILRRKERYYNMSDVVPILTCQSVNYAPVRVEWSPSARCSGRERAHELH